MLDLGTEDGQTFAAHFSVSFFPSHLRSCRRVKYHFELFYCRINSVFNVQSAIIEILMVCFTGQ